LIFSCFGLYIFCVTIYNKTGFIVDNINRTIFTKSTLLNETLPGQTGWSELKIPIYAGNSKSQISNSKQITMTEIQNPKHTQDIEKRTYQSCFGH